MSKHNSRKEPTFGEPKSTQTEIDFSEPVEQIRLPKVSLSQTSKQKPSYTFSTVLKRPAELAKDFTTFEEMSMLKKEQAQAEHITQDSHSAVQSLPVVHIQEQSQTDQPLQAQSVVQTAQTQPIQTEQSVAHTTPVKTVQTQQPIDQIPLVQAKQTSPVQHVQTEPYTTQVSAVQPVHQQQVHATSYTDHTEETRFSFESEQVTKNAGLTFSPMIEKDEVPTVTLDNPSNTPGPLPAVSVKSDFERVIPTTAHVTPKEQPVKKSSSYLRLLIVILLIAALGLLIWFLKPSVQEAPALTSTNGLPQEFRPLNEEEAKRAEANALQQTREELEASARMQAQQEIERVRTQLEAEARQKQQEQLQAQQQTQLAQQAKARAEAEAQAKLQAQQAKARAEAEAQAKLQAQLQAKARIEAEAQARAEAEAQARLQAQKFKNASQNTQTELSQALPQNSSVIYQPEGEVKSADKKPNKTAQSGPTKMQENELDKLVNQLGSVNQKPAMTEVQGEPSTKVFIVKRGVSVMQLFREYNLDISDVNAMNRANKILSNLKAGEKLTVKLDKNNHVAEMSLSSGGRFIRQANGTYLYK